FVARLLRKYGNSIQISRGFGVIDSSYQKALIKKIMKDLGIDLKSDRSNSEEDDDDVFYSKPEQYLSEISLAKNKSMSAVQYQESIPELEEGSERKMERDREFKKNVARVFLLYEENLRRKSLLDFD